MVRVTYVIKGNPLKYYWECPETELKTVKNFLREHEFIIKGIVSVR